MVYVVLEAQYQSALGAAVKKINADNDKVCIEIIGYLLEELRDPASYAAFQADVASANLFIGSLIFIEELAEKIVETVGAARDSLDACLIFPSMPAVMKLNKLGTFSLAQIGAGSGGAGGKASPFAEFMRSQRKNNDNFEESLLKLVRTLPAVLKYLPSEKAQDARNFVTSLQYWLGGNAENLENLLLNVGQEYVPALKGAGLSIADPVVFPDIGIWHPLAPRMFEDLKEYLNWYDTRPDLAFAADAPVVGLVLQRSHLVTGDEGHYSGVVSELEARGAKVVPVFAGGLDFSSPVKRFFYDPLGSGKAFVGCVVSLTGFALVGGPARQDAPKAVETLKKLDVPYLCSLPLVFQTTEEWLGSELGVHPVQVALQVALPELDGALEPIVFAGRDSATVRFFFSSGGWGVGGCFLSFRGVEVEKAGSTKGGKLTLSPLSPLLSSPLLSSLSSLSSLSNNRASRTPSRTASTPSAPAPSTGPSSRPSPSTTRSSPSPSFRSRRTRATSARPPTSTSSAPSRKSSRTSAGTATTSATRRSTCRPSPRSPTALRRPPRRR